MRHLTRDLVFALAAAATLSLFASSPAWAPAQPHKPEYITGAQPGPNETSDAGQKQTGTGDETGTQQGNQATCTDWDVRYKRYGCTEVGQVVQY